MKRTHHRRTLVKTFLGLTMLSILLVGVASWQRVSAANPFEPTIGGTMPAGNTDGLGNGTIWLDISKECKPAGNCNGRQLNAPISYAKLYYKYADGEKARVQGGHNNNISDAKDIVYHFYSTDENEDKIAGCEVSFSFWAIGSPWDPDWATKSFNWGASCKPKASKYTGFYTVQATVGWETSVDDVWFNTKIQAYCSNDSGGGEHGICVAGSSKANLAGAWAKVNEPSAPLALEDEDFQSGSGTCSPDSDCYDIWLGLGTPCDLQQNYDAELKWSDADADNGQPDNPAIYYELFGSTDNGATWSLLKKETNDQNLGGNLETKTYDLGPLNLEPGERLIWHWGGIVKNNDPQLWIPWDQVNYTVDCSAIPGYENQAHFINSPPTQVEPKKTYTIDAELTNVGEVASPDSSWLRVSNDNYTLTKDPRDATGDGTEISTPGYHPNLTDDCQSSGGLPPPSNRSPCWFWEYNALQPGDKHDVSFTFTVDNNATDGDQVCFTPYAHPENANDGEYADPQLCIPVVAPRHPFLETGNSDVHAGTKWGDVACLSDPGTPTGSITGQVDAGSNTGSKADYVVSAGGVITNFGSGGSPTGSGLTFGYPSTDSNYYGQVCRPDLAYRYRNAQTYGSSTINPGNIPSGIRRHVGDVTLTAGTIGIGQQSTLVVEGNVEITGNIGFGDGYNSIGDIPSFGLIATGTINIHHDVTNIYGIYVAGTDPANWDPGIPTAGYINTCQDDLSAPPTWNPNPLIASDDPAGNGRCEPQLKVNGSLIAVNFLFRRTPGDVKSGNQSDYSESIALLPQLLLRPPQGLGGVASQISVRGEFPPLY